MKRREPEILTPLMDKKLRTMALPGSSLRSDQSVRKDRRAGIFMALTLSGRMLLKKTCRMAQVQGKVRMDRARVWRMDKTWLTRRIPEVSAFK